MGRDLKLLPYWSNFSVTVLDVPVDDGLFSKISKLYSQPVEADFWSLVSIGEEYEEYHYGKTAVNPYGEQVVRVMALQLKGCYIDGPVGAYIDALDDDWPVALFWD